MTKDNIRDYATAAFRFYAKNGSKEEYLSKLQLDAQRENGSGVSKPTEAALISKETILQTKAAEFADIDAVARTIYQLSLSANGAAICKAIEYVYFKDCWKDLEKGDIQDRVHHAEIYIPASERQIYRWLKTVRNTFALERGLRI